MNRMFAFIWIALKHIKYEIIYYILGARGIFEDLIYSTKNKCEPIRKTGEFAVITGGARGLGAVVVKKLLQCDMHVIIGCRKPEAAENVVKKIRENGIGTGSVTILQIDMASLESIKRFANDVKNKADKLHILINNAGIMFSPYLETEDGFESHWGVNYIGHFYLTHLLLGTLIETSNLSDTNTRIINVTSCAHFAGNKIDFHDVNMKNNYIPSAAYAQSKLAQLMFTKILDHRLKNEGKNVRVLAVHPGIVDTDIFNGTFLKTLFPWVIKLLFKTADQGATSILYTSVSPILNNKGGIYISNCCESPVSKIADDPLQQEQLFKHSLSSLDIIDFGKIN
ncbi:polyprenol dehydrogenase-like [Lycorma delicatula]|uniref:polyprenol dehydrogenase-like n=1 Tax=Lycorma delicatula TaxID=130591 RepID=UPI003F513A63